jgi:hypothetical protein
LIFGKWDDSYDLLPTYRAELLKAVLESIVELDIENHHGMSVLEDSLFPQTMYLMVFYKDAGPTLL